MNDQFEDTFNLKCLPAITISGSTLNVSAKGVIEIILEGDKDIMDEYLADTLKLLVGEQYPGEQKFYTLLFLAMITITKNVTFQKRLSKNKELLNKIFQDAQFGKKDNPMQRGRYIFSRNPTQDQIKCGKNYHRLALEFISFCYKSFAKNDQSSRRHIYHLMYSSLSHRVYFPSEFFILSDTIELEEDFHIKQHIPLPCTQYLYQNASIRSLESTTSLSSLSEDSCSEYAKKAKKHVMSCIRSGSIFQQNIDTILKEVGLSNTEYNSPLISQIVEVMENIQYAPTQKFYTALIIVKCSELGNDQFYIDFVNNGKILDIFFKLAQFNKNKPLEERGAQYFTAKPNSIEQVLGQNLINLSIECVKYWNVNAHINNLDALKDQKKQKIFKLMYNAIKDKVALPNQQYAFFEKGSSFSFFDNFEITPSSESIQKALSARQEDLRSEINHDTYLVQEFRAEIKDFCTFTNDENEEVAHNFTFFINHVSHVINALSFKCDALDRAQDGAQSQRDLDITEPARRYVETVQEVLADLQAVVNKTKSYDEVQAILLVSLADAQHNSGVKQEAPQKPIQEQIPDYDTAINKLSCTICFLQPKEILFNNCKHLCVCSQCFKNLQRIKEAKCPICREKVEGHTKVYIV